MQKKPRRYESDAVVVGYHTARCIHAAECVARLPSVFDPGARPWIRPAEAGADAIARVVEACPSGALFHERRDGGDPERAPDRNTIEVVPDGPVYVRGRIRLRLPGGEVREETRVALCRCGASAMKPYCDGSHRAAGFADPGAVPEKTLGAGSGGETLEISPARNGPLLLDGPFTAAARGGAPTARGGKGALCRCGHSSTKPFCDGTHNRIDFVAD